MKRHSLKEDEDMLLTSKAQWPGWRASMIKQSKNMDSGSIATPPSG
jgi:hypothetical protein